MPFADALNTLINRHSKLLLLIPNAAIRLSLDWRRRPIFHDVDAICPTLHQFEANFDRIKSEYLALRASGGRVPRYDEVDGRPHVAPFSKSEDANKSWRILFLEVAGRKCASNRRMLPVTAQLLDSIPGVFQACFSVVEGSQPIASHTGPYLGYLRYHIGIDVPEGAPPRMRILDKWVTWREGEGFIFDDSFDHEVVNESREARTILIVDIDRPMGLLGRIVHATMKAILRQTYGRWVIAKSEQPMRGAGKPAAGLAA